jgi:hypothetical protein
MFNLRSIAVAAAGACALTFAPLANATSYSGTVSLLEVWPNGNIAFSLSGATLPCNGQAILNKSQDGTKNMYAALLAAKHTGKTVSIEVTGCGTADGYYPNVLYAIPLFFQVN